MSDVSDREEVLSQLSDARRYMKEGKMKNPGFWKKMSNNVGAWLKKCLG